MADSAVPLAIYFAIALIVVIAIFLGALRFANAAKKGSAQFGRGQRRSMGQDDERVARVKNGTSDENGNVER